MQNSVPSIAVGISAFNEEANIKYLLEAILAQKQEGFVVRQIIVVSDGSTDNTIALARSVGDDRIEVRDHKDRKGLAERQNELVQALNADYIALFNADVLPKGRDLFIKTIKPFLQNNKVGLVSCRCEALEALTFVEDAVNFSVRLKNRVFEKLKNGQNVYSCHGQYRLFKRELAKQIQWPAAVGEDAYSYLFCIDKGFEFVYVPDTVVVYRSPQTLKDHFKQAARFKKSKVDLSQNFPSLNLAKEYVVPKNLLIKEALMGLVWNPILFISYGLIHVLGVIERRQFKVEQAWDMVQSSKKLM